MTEYIARSNKNDRYIPISYANRARLFLVGKNFCNTKKLGTHLGIPPRTATTIYKAIGWEWWARGTYYRPGTFDKE